MSTGTFLIRGPEQVGFAGCRYAEDLSPADPTEPGLALVQAAKRRRNRPGDAGSVPSFARRVRPNTSNAVAQWSAIRDAFNMIIRPRLDGCASTLRTK